MNFTNCMQEMMMAVDFFILILMSPPHPHLYVRRMEGTSEGGGEDAEMRLAIRYRRSEQGLLQSIVQQCLYEKMMLGAV